MLGTYEISQQQQQQQQQQPYHHPHRGIVKCIQDGTVLYHIPFETLEKLESTDPLLIVNLYKLLTNVMARKEDLSISQLSTFHNIMTGNY